LPSEFEVSFALNLSLTATMSTGDVQFQRDCLESHNKIRREYGAAPLTWSQDLADQAQHWAEKLAEKGHLLYSELPGIC